MIKKVISFVLLIAIAIPLLSKDVVNNYCAFCDSNVLARQKFYEDDLVIALYTHKPIFPGHCLIIPKRHVPRFELLSDEEAMQIHLVIKKVNQAVQQAFSTNSYLILQKNGYEVGQTVPHVHFHYIPRRDGDDSSLKFIFRMYWVNINGPLSSNELEDVVLKMRTAMASVLYTK